MSARRLAVALSLVIATLGPPAAAQSPAEPQWLLVTQGIVAELRPGTIILDAPPGAIVFADRPDRDVAMIDLRGFVAAAWGEAGELRLDPPNASIITDTGHIAIIEITDAIYDNGQLTLWVTLLEGEVPDAGDHIGITIDAFPTAVNDQITDAVTQ